MSTTMQDKSPPAFSIGKELRLSQTRNDREFPNIGPGKYNNETIFVNKTKSPMFSMGAKLRLGSSMTAPNLFTPEQSRYTPKY